MPDNGPQYPLQRGDAFLERVGRFDLHTHKSHPYLYVRGPNRPRAIYDFDVLAFTHHPDGSVTWNEQDFPVDTDPTPAEICDIIAACARYNYQPPEEPE